jgi:hypothetical protein
MNRFFVRRVSSLFLTLNLVMSATLFANQVTDWNDQLLAAVRTDGAPPPRASRAMAMVHICVYDAVAAIHNASNLPSEVDYDLYHSTAQPMEGASAEAAAAAAAHRMLVQLYPAQAETLDGALDESLAGIEDGPAKDNGVHFGRAVADEFFAVRAADGSAMVVQYSTGTEPGDWQPTAPAFAPALLPQWPAVTPFAMTSGSQFRSGGPPALTTVEYAAALFEVQRLGRVDSSVRTAEQAEIAHFWADGAGTSTPPGHWNRIAKTVAIQRGNSLLENARLFALLNMALADAAIVSWDNKYAFDFWRPITACQNADIDGNDATVVDPDWTPLINTPPFPEYTSGHSTFSSAAARILGRFFGTDEVQFDSDSEGLAGVTRSFSRFSDAAAEAGKSRIYGGIHYEFSNADAQNAGRDLGDFVFDNYLGAKVDAVPPGGIALCGALGNCGAMTGANMAMLGLFLGCLSLLSRRRR